MFRRCLGLKYAEHGATVSMKRSIYRKSLRSTSFRPQACYRDFGLSPYLPVQHCQQVPKFGIPLDPIWWYCGTEYILQIWRVTYVGTYRYRLSYKGSLIYPPLSLTLMLSTVSDSSISLRARSGFSKKL